MLCKKHKYFVLYRGDDTDFPGNQELIVELNTERDLTGCSAHFSFQGFTQDFAEIPSDKKLRLVIPNSATGKFALGAADAKLWLTNGTKVRTVENRIHIVVTNRVDEAYDNDDPQAITVTISGGGGGETVVLDDTVTEKSPNGVKSSGIWSWVKSLLPHWLTSDYAEPATVASIANKRDKGDLAVYSVTRTENTDWTWTSENKELEAALNEASVKPIYDSENHFWVITGTTHWGEFYYNSPGVYDVDALSVRLAFITIPGYVDYYATATRPRYMDETLGPAKPNQQLAAVATDDASKPSNGDLMKYDASNDRFVKAVEGTDYIKTHQDISGKLDKSGGQMTGTLSGGNGFGWIMNRQGESLDDTLGTFPTYLDLDTKADRATTLDGYGITDGATKDSLSLEYSETSAYSVGAIVYHDGNIYQCKTAIADGGEAWNATHWEMRKLDDFFTDSNGLLTGTIAAKSIPAFSSLSAYEVGEIVIYGGVAYKCVTAITPAEEWTAAHWTLATNSDLAARLKGLKSDGTATDAFATDLLGKPVAKEAIDEEIIDKGTAPDAHLEAPTDERLKLVLADNSVAYDSAKALPYKLTSAIGDRVIATMTLTAASTDITLPAIAANDTTARDFILDVTNAYAVEGVATDAGINIPRTDFKLVTRDGESLTDVTTVKAGKSAFICFTQKSPVVVNGTTYPCWCVIQLPFGDPS